ncbi:putative metal-dependent hydrolase of the TIM-barrel fold protein [Variovorax sp. SRS16]|uniref:amidohydrolase family protein n=1 Tax=Variovorax sp. SRS16 TaxID=282217 RepID=UPI0013188581|nr:amidohydrolase family protein [Variovorax sp. SRS16]VTU14263.1 putative metal-dependent hydrolase of the TIM-barrel fold protein [Variovorax sp. SRS16]
MTVIDVHTHMFTTKWLELLKAEGGMYNIKTRPDGQREIFRGDTPVVLPQAGHFDYDLRIKHMDAAGIDISIVSLTCPNVYWGGEEVSCRAARESNDNMAEAQRTYPDRIRWFTSLPWEYPQRAVEELERTCANGASGVMVLANVSGRSLTDPFFAPIWAEIDKRKLPVLVHPTDPPGVDMMDMTKFDLSWSVGFMFDTTLAFTRMIFEGFFDKYPNLKMIASHGGGTLPYLVGRFEKGDEVELAERRQMKRKPTDYLRHIYFDSITYNLGALQYLISVVGAEHVMLGTDWPHWVHDTKGAFANTARLPQDQTDAVRFANARRVFNL